MGRKYSIQIICAICALFLFQNCSSNGPTNKDFVGSWFSSDGATFVFDSNGKFFADNLVRGTMGFPDDQKNKLKFSGSGEWTLQGKVGNYWEIKLIFDRCDSLKTGFGTDILVGGGNGVFSNRSPWYLFMWKEEEGGERYIFKHK